MRDRTYANELCMCCCVPDVCYSCPMCYVVNTCIIYVLSLYLSHHIYYTSYHIIGRRHRSARECTLLPGRGKERSGVRKGFG